MGSFKLILDSNVFIALYFVNDSLHEKAVLLMEGVDDIDILVPYCVVQEVATILTYRLGKTVANKFLSDLKTAGNMFLIDDDVDNEIDFFESVEKKISFTDSSLLYLAGKYRANLVTFDQDLLKLYKKRSQNK